MNANALLIGVNRYGHGSDLAGCLNDAMDWAELLENHGFRAKVLRDRDGTKDNILDALTDMLAHVRPHETCFFGFSGHGSWTLDTNGDESDQRDECLVCHGMTPDDLLMDDEIRMLLEERPEGSRVVCVFDSCHSGTVARNPHAGRKKFIPPSLIFGEQVYGMLADRVPKKKKPANLPGVASFSACGDKQLASDAEFDGRPNGAFSYYAMRAIRELGQEATYRDVGKAINQYLPSREYDQRPELHADNRMKKRTIFK